MIARSVTKVSWGSCKGLTLSTNEEMFSLREDWTLSYDCICKKKSFTY